MSTNKTDKDSPQDNFDDDNDVTQIVPASKPDSENEGADATQILPARSSVQPTQQLPGTVIGMVGSVADGSAASEQAPVKTSATPDVGSDDEAATKILFNTDSQAATTAGSQQDPKSSAQGDNLNIARSTDQTDSHDDPIPEDENTVFLTPDTKSEDQDDFNPPVGWLVVMEGPGRGTVLNIHYGQNTIGRGEEQDIRLNFGDTQVTRETHAFILYDELERTFFLRDAGKKNLVRINKTPVMTPTQLHSHDQIQIGATTCLFVPLCNDAFDWLGGEDDPATGPPEEDKSE